MPHLISPLVRATAALLIASVILTPAAAQDFSGKPIRIIVPWAPGGNVDITARALAPGLGEALGTQVIIENKPGAGGTIGTALVVKSAPDGHTLVLGSTGAVTIAPSVIKSAGFDPVKDLVAVGAIHNAAMVITAASKTPVANFKELVAHALARNGQMSVATPGIASTNHLAMELVAMQAGFKFVHVPFKGAGPALNDLLASQVETMIDQIPPSLPHIKEGRIKALAITMPKRLAVLPDVPTLDELGLKDFNASTFTGLFGPAGMPQAVLDKLAVAHKKVMADQKLRDRYMAMGVEMMDISREDFATFIKVDFEKWKKVVEVAKITAE